MARVAVSRSQAITNSRSPCSPRCSAKIALDQIPLSSYPAFSEIENGIQFRTNKEALTSLFLWRQPLLERFWVMLSIFTRSSLIILFSVLLIPVVLGQTKKTVVRGKVVDPNHAVIPGADVWASVNGLPS